MQYTYNIYELCMCLFYDSSQHCWPIDSWDIHSTNESSWCSTDYQSLKNIVLHFSILLSWRFIYCGGEVEYFNGLLTWLRAFQPSRFCGITAPMCSIGPAIVELTLRALWMAAGRATGSYRPHRELWFTNGTAVNKAREAPQASFVSSLQVQIVSFLLLGDSITRTELVVSNPILRKGLR